VQSPLSRFAPARAAVAPGRPAGPRPRRDGARGLHAFDPRAVTRCSGVELSRWCRRRTCRRPLAMSGWTSPW